MNKALTLLMATGMSAFAIAQAPTVKISIGVRETEAGGSTVPGQALGSNGGTMGSLEWVDIDNQTLTLDGTWQQFTFNMGTATLTPFTGDGAWQGTLGVLEHIRVKIDNVPIDPVSGVYSEEITLWIDDVSNTATGVTPWNLDFEGFADDQEILVQEPTFSGSTSGNFVSGTSTRSPGYNYVCDPATGTGIGAQQIGPMQFVDNSTTRWARLTTFNFSQVPNPVISLDPSSVVTFWMRGGKHQPIARDITGTIIAGTSTAIGELIGEGLGSGEAATYYMAGASPGNPGVVAVSLGGAPDLALFGGTLVSFGGYLTAFSVVADGTTGRASLPLSVPAVPIIPVDLVFQSAFLDFNAPPSFIALTNANTGRVGF